MNITTWFFADDGLLLTNNVQDTKMILIILEEIGRMFWLEINRSKSFHVININKNEVSQINNKRIVNKIKCIFYIYEGRNCFKKHYHRRMSMPFL